MESFAIYIKRPINIVLLLLMFIVSINVVVLDVYYAQAEDEGTEGLVSINFRETDMREVLNILAYKGGVNIIAGDDVDAKVSVQLKDVPWENALDAILRTYNFTYKKEDTLIRVMSLQRALEEENKVPLVTKIVPLNFADVDGLKNSLSKVLSKRGSIMTDPRTNSLIITDIPGVVDKVEAASIALDTLTPQVLIEAMMVDVKITKDDKWGFKLDQLGNDSATRTLAYDLSAGDAASGSGQFSFVAALADLNVDAVIDMWQQENKAQILANPKVLTLDHQEARIEIIEEIPYLESVDTGGGVTTTVKFKEAGIKLNVTPHITSGNFISMNIKPEQSFKSAELDGQPIIDKRLAETNLLVKDGQTIVIGGLRRVNDAVTFDKVPGFGDIPFLGLFFKRKSTSKVETELILFVTPHIITQTEMSDREIDLYMELEHTEPLALDDTTELNNFKNKMKRRRERQKAKKLETHETVRRQKRKNLKQRQDERPAVDDLSLDLPVEEPPVTVISPVEEKSQLPVMQNKRQVLDIEAEQLRKILYKVKREIAEQEKMTNK
ncbi:MAG: hypothetical protein GY853_08145 [PVC group bacterium]|nr:hypothetical protein [PVC group bacterium]